MPFFIRRKDLPNRVFVEQDEQIRRNLYADITPTTKCITVAVFTTRRDAEDVIEDLGMECFVSNNLEYQN